MFTPDQLEHIVRTTIPVDLPAGHTNAVVGAVDNEGARVVAKFALDDQQRWTFIGAWDHDWDTGNDSTGAKLLYSWGHK